MTVPPIERAACFPVGLIPAGPVRHLPSEAVSDDRVRQPSVDPKLSDRQAVLDRVATIAVGTSTAADRPWRSVTAPLHVFLAGLTEHREGLREGASFLQGELIGSRRQPKAMWAMEHLAVEIGTGESGHQINARVRAAGLLCVRYSAYGHLRDRTRIARRDYLSWAGKSEVIVADLRRYLVDVMGYPPSHVEDLEIIASTPNPDRPGRLIRVEHLPIARHCAVFPLAQPFVLHRGSNKAAIREWGERYAGFCAGLGLRCDKASTDPARLFSFPRHPPGQPYEVEVIQGGPLDLGDCPRLKLDPPPARPRRRAAGGIEAAAEGAA